MSSTRRLICHTMPAPARSSPALVLSAAYVNFFELDQTPSGSGAAFGIPNVRSGGRARPRPGTADRGLTPFIGRGEIITVLLNFSAANNRTRDVAPSSSAAPGSARRGCWKRYCEQWDREPFTLLRGQLRELSRGRGLAPFLQILRAFFGIRADAQSRRQTARAALQPWLAELGPRAESILGLVSDGCRGTRQPLAAAAWSATSWPSLRRSPQSAVGAGDR